jgi:hypothetical protein
MIPTPPERPEDWSCCGRGCCPCIFDYYQDALARWKARVRDPGAIPRASGEAGRGRLSGRA